MDSNSSIPEVLVRMLMNEVLRDPDKIRKISLESLRLLGIGDVAYLLNKTEKTIRVWQESGKIRMNVGPDGHLCWSYKEFEAWYRLTYKTPPPKL